VDETGQEVSRGRNRTIDGSCPGQLGGSRLAHAEVNALLGLTSERTYEGFILYTSWQPCHLCLSATIAVRVGNLGYARQQTHARARSENSSRARITKLIL
jgi:tRNA(Arg) A34 adenosine deaminase TadA